MGLFIKEPKFEVEIDTESVVPVRENHTKRSVDAIYKPNLVSILKPVQKHEILLL